MRRLIPLIFVLLVACAAQEGTWPSLARRAGEAAPMVPRPGAGERIALAPAMPGGMSPPVAERALSPVPASSATPPVAIDDIAARIDTVARDLDDIAVRLRVQRSALDTAVRGARGSATGSEAGGTVELETTRLDRIGGQVTDARDRLDAIAGTLADAAAGGTDVSAPIARAGGLIARTRGLDAEVKAALTATATVSGGARLSR